MKKVNIFRGLRVLLAIFFFIPILIFFVDFADVLPDKTHRLLEVQIIPAILTGSFIIILIQAAIAVLFGRIYCSTLCPAGILQDIISRISNLFRRFSSKRKKNIHRRFAYHKPMNVLRYGLLSVSVIAALFGVLEFIVILDPYSNFGRIATNLFRPIVTSVNNALAEGLMTFDNYSLYRVTLHTIPTSGIVFGLIALMTFVLMVVFRGRLFCNTLCPVGGMLSVFSRFSLFRITLDQEKCIKCKSCEKTCKTEAINAREMTVDSSRCVDCFNCLSSCHKDAISYKLNMPLDMLKKQKTRETVAESKADVGRRNFFSTSATVVASLPAVSLFADIKPVFNDEAKIEATEPITPPGALNIDRFKDICTGCQICVVQCPSQVLKPSGFQFGFDYMMRPYVSYDSTFCNYNCRVCADVCPTEAIKPITLEEKQTTQIGIAKFYPDRCVVTKDGTDCGACSEHCPTQAVKMVPLSGSLRIPEVTPDICIGCGGCESICPVNPNRAIVILPQSQHVIVKKPEMEEKRDVQVDDFGF